MNTYKGPNVSYTPMAQENNDAGQEPSFPPAKKEIPTFIYAINKSNSMNDFTKLFVAVFEIPLYLAYKGGTNDINSCLKNGIRSCLLQFWVSGIL